MPFVRRPDSWLYLSGSKGPRNEDATTAPAGNDSLPEFVSETIPQPMAPPDAPIAPRARTKDVAASPTRIQFSTADFRTATRRPTSSQTSERRALTTFASLALRAQRLRARSIEAIRVPAWASRVPELRRLAASTTLASFGGGAVAGVLITWFVAAHPSPVMPPTAQTVIQQTTLPAPDPRASPSNGQLAAEAVRPSSSSVPSSTVSITAQPVGTSGHNRVASAPSVRPRKAAAAPRASYRGSLAFQSAPQGARVFVNGTFVGSTPLILQNLPVGSRAVRIEADGYQRWSASTRVVANQETRVSATLGRTRP
jgi:hypothetical protein